VNLVPLTQCNKGESVIVRTIDTKNKELKKRLYSLSIIPNSELLISHISLAKQTYQIKNYSTLIALRQEEASHIFVEKTA